MIGYATVGTNDYPRAVKFFGELLAAIGARSDNFYTGYFRDLDGNKLSVFTMA
jgi:hypothetical protein